MGNENKSSNPINLSNYQSNHQQIMTRVWTFNNQQSAENFFTELQQIIATQTPQMIQIMETHIEYIKVPNIWKVIATIEYPSVSLCQDLIRRKRTLRFFNERQLWLILSSVSKFIINFRTQLNKQPQIASFLFWDKQKNIRIANPRLLYSSQTKKGYNDRQVYQILSTMLFEAALLQKIARVTKNHLKKLQFIYPHHELPQIFQKIAQQKLFTELFDLTPPVKQPLINLDNFQVPRQENRFANLTEFQSIQILKKVEQCSKQMKKNDKNKAGRINEISPTQKINIFKSTQISSKENYLNEFQFISIKSKELKKSQFINEYHNFPKKNINFKKKQKKNLNQSQLIRLIQVKQTNNQQEMNDFSPIFKRKQGSLLEMGNDFVESFVESDDSHVNSPQRMVEFANVFDQDDEQVGTQSVSVMLSYIPSLYQRNSTIPQDEGEQQEQITDEGQSKKYSIQDQQQIIYQTIHYDGGSRYQGYTKNHRRHGKGVFYDEDGGFYDGEWKNDQMHGYGELYSEQTTLVYAGYWKQDRFEGEGHIFNPDYEELMEGFNYFDFNSLGFKWKSYKGTFIQDQKDGYGILTVSNGEYLIGRWTKNLVDGPAQYHRLNGQVIKGVWKNNILLKD